MQCTAKYFKHILFALALSSASLFAQTVTSSLEGVVVDPADAAVANAPVTLNSQTGSARTATTDNTGTYRFLQVEPGTYNLTVKATGFKALTQTGIVISASETHNGGKMVLQLGSVCESVSVTAEVVQVQLEVSEKSQTVDAGNLEDLTLKGRDLFIFSNKVNILKSFLIELSPPPTYQYLPSLPSNVFLFQPYIFRDEPRLIHV